MYTYINIKLIQYTVCQLLKIPVPVLSAADTHYVSVPVTQMEAIQAHHSAFAHHCPSAQQTVLCTYSPV